MRFKIYSEEFKKNVEKVMVISNNKCIMPYSTVKIEAKDGEVHLVASNFADFIRVKLNAACVEDGIAYVPNEYIQKILNMKGDIEVYSDEKSISTSNGAKKSKVAVYIPEADDEGFDVPAIEEHEIMAINENKLYELLEKCECCRSKDEAKGILTGFHFNGSTNCIETLDGYRLMQIRIEAEESHDFNYDFTICGEIIKYLKKIRNKKADSVVKINRGKYDGKYYIIIKGNDYEIYSREMEGNYVKTAEILRKDGEIGFNFDVNSKQMSDIGKEYEKVVKGKDKTSPMYVTVIDDKMVTYVSDECGYATCDKVELSNVTFPEKTAIAYNPTFIKEVFAQFDDGCEVSCVSKKNVCVSPMFIEDGHGMLALILPVRPKENMYEIISEFVA